MGGMKKLALITPLTSILPPVTGDCIFMAPWGVGIGAFFAAYQNPSASSMGTYATAISVAHRDRAGRCTIASSSLRCRFFVIVEDFTLFIHWHTLPRLIICSRLGTCPRSGTSSSPALLGLNGFTTPTIF